MKIKPITINLFKKANYTRLLGLLVLMVLVCFPIFQHLDDLAIELWDESRLAANTFQMLENKKFIVTYFEGQPEMWNTKPPFFIWCQAISLSLFGFNEVALRLPSAMAVLFTCFGIFYFLYKKTNTLWSGTFVILALITCEGFMLCHTGRSANYDAMLTLFLVGSAISFYQIVETNKSKYYYLLFIFLTLAVLTKSIAGLFFLPAFLIYAIAQNKLLLILKNKHFYTGALFFCSVIATYYFVREIQNPGYLNAVLENEITGRFLKVNEGHDGNFFTNYQYLINQGIPTWYHLLILFGMSVGLFSIQKSIKTITLFSLIICLTFYVTISVSKTILFWYTMPLFPFLAVLFGFGFYHLFLVLKNIKSTLLAYNIYPYLFIIFIFSGPYFTMFIKTIGGNYTNEEPIINKITGVLRAGLYKNASLNNYTIVWSNPKTNFLCYTYLLKQKKNIKVDVKVKEEIIVGDRIFTTEEHALDYLQLKFKLQKVDYIEQLEVYHVLEKTKIK